MPEPAFHRAQCPVCNTLCEQRRRSVLLPGGEKSIAYDCLECEMVYLVAEPAASSEPTPAESHRLAEQMYGCVNCRHPDPRYCAEAGHRDCDAGKVAAELARGEP